MKKLINLLFGFTFCTLPLFSQDFLPKDFRNYWEKGILSSQYHRVSDTLAFIARSYDIDRNLWADVWEIHSVKNPSTDSIVSEYPENYLFDFNRNGSFSEEELASELIPDGLNGNEIFIKPREIHITSKKEVDL